MALGLLQDHERTATATAAGQFIGLAVYFELQAGPSPFLSTHPGVVDATNHWHSPVRVINPPIALQPGDRFAVTYLYRPVPGTSGCQVRLCH
jgi:hypothetical protein